METSSGTSSANQTDQRTASESITIQTTNLSKRFNREWIFRDFSYQFTSGNTYAITGPNGSGKSTFIQVLWGQVPQTSGEIIYKSDNKIIPVENIHRHISIATPYMDLIDEFTLMEQLRFHFRLKSIRNNITMEDLIKIMYLENARDKFIGNFSSGMKQRVKLALALYTQADIIFLDEPGTNLDQQAFSWYVKELLHLSPQSLVFIASNNPAEYHTATAEIRIPDFKKGQKADFLGR